MAITYIALSDRQKMETADLLQKLESVRGALADIQTERATAEIEYRTQEEELKAEENKLLQTVRNIRKPTIAMKI